MTRSNLGKLHIYDPKIDRIFHRLIRSLRSSEVANNSHNGSAFASNYTVLKFDNADFDFYPATCDSDLGVCISKFCLDNIADNNRTLKELTTPDIMSQPWCIQYPKLEQAQLCELKSGLIHLLSKFHGLAYEDPHKHLKEFHAYTTEFIEGFSQVDGYKQHSISTKCDRYNSILTNIDWTIGHNYESTKIQRFWADSFSNHS
ncbi:hypothetical protein CR513_42600, partial [Mucuna pruriens]